MTVRRAPDIYLDIDRERITSMVDLAYDHVAGLLGLSSLHKSKESILLELSTILESSRVSTPFFLDFSSPKMNDFRIRVDPRRKELLGTTMRFEKLKNQINSFLRAL